MALSEIDRQLLDRCLKRVPRSWEDFIDRFMGLVMYVIDHTAQARSIRLTDEEREDLCAEVFLAIVQDEFALLRRFRGRSSLATYLTVIARRIAVRELLQRKMPSRGVTVPGARPAEGGEAEQRVSDREEVARLMEGLNGSEAEVVRMYHLEGKTYQEISSAVGMPENSVGPTLSRAREKMRRTREAAT